jgi:predicted Zn-dependent protease
MFKQAAIFILLALGACATIPAGPVWQPGTVDVPVQSQPMRRDVSAGVADYRRAAARVEPVATRMCREIYPARPRNYCAFDFRLVDDPRLGPNAFQTVGEDGAPVVAMTIQLVAETDNADEVAFILSHEAAHHVAGHIEKSQTQAMAGALVFGTLAGLGDASEEVMREMMDLGASLGGRVYSQSYELEADELGTLIAIRAGFDPVRGAVIFTRAALSGGGGLLSTHPASLQRQAAVAQTAARIREGRTGSP